MTDAPNESEILTELRPMIEQVNALRGLAYEYYFAECNELIAGRVVDSERLSRVPDDLLNCCDDDRFLALFRAVCRRYIFYDPELIRDYIYICRDMWDTAEESEDQLWTST